MSPLTPNLSLNLGRVTPSVSSGRIGRAQDFSVSKLQDKKDRENAKVSIEQIARQGENRPVSSVAHLSGQTLTSASVAHTGTAASSSIYGENYDKEADERRYEYIRGLAMARRKEKEAAGAKSIYDTGVKTGALFKTTGVLGMRRSLIRARYQKPGEFKNLSSKDRQYFEDLIKKYVKGVPTGAGIGHHARRAMKQHILRDRRKGAVNVEDANDFYKMIDALPKVKRGLM